MNKYKLLIILIIIRESVYSQSPIKAEINNYEDHCFCNTGLSHPMDIINMDNNLELIIALKKGKTVTELNNQCIKYNNSQLNLLRYSGLIEKNDSIYQTIIPIFSENETNHLRERTQSFANEIVHQNKNDFECLSNTLKSQGLQKNSYSIFFAFVLDGLVWDFLEQGNDIEETQITKEKPFWDGTFWMMKPKRHFSCGTNCLSSGNYTINENWSDFSVISIVNYKLLRELLNDYKENGSITKPEIIKEFDKNKLFDRNGKLQIPIIKEDSTDLIYLQSKTIAQKVVEYLRKDIDYSTVFSDYQMIPEGKKITILYHEIMWDILDIMENTKLLSKPIIFKNPQEAKPEDLKDLLFIVKE